MSNTSWSEGDVSRILSNPFYAITFDPSLFIDHEPIISKEQWVQANVRMIEQMGAEAYVRQLLEILEGNYPRGEEIRNVFGQGAAACGNCFFGPNVQAEESPLTLS
jgi:hypothetical protein